ncbi:reverse transcriptase domain-containing protein [Tanacetum coccineum]
MRTRSQSRDPNRPQQQVPLPVVEPFNLEEPINQDPPEPPIVTMADQRTTAELLRAPTEGYAEAIVVPPILAEHFELKHSLINMMTSDQFFRLEKDNSHVHIRWFNKITSTIKYKDVPNSAIKLMLFPFSLAGAARRWLEKEPPVLLPLGMILFPNSSMSSFPLENDKPFRNEISTFQQRFDESFHEAWDRYKDLLHSLNSAAGGNLLERRTTDVLRIIENKSKVFNQQTSAVTTAMTAILKQFQATPPPAFVKAVKEVCVTCGGAHPYYQCLAADGNTFPKYQDNIQGYVAATADLFANPKGELKAITTRSGLVLDGPSVPIPPPFINPEEDEREEETLIDPEHGEFTIKVPPPLIQKAKPHSQRNYVVHQRDPRHPHIPYPSRMNQKKQKEKDKVKIHKFWQMFKQLHINTSLANALILIPKYQKMLKSLLSNKEKLTELANTPLNENCSAVILKKLPEKLKDPGKFLIPCGFSKLKCKALANLGASINLMPLPVWKKLGLPELISTQMTLELANRAICTPKGIAKDVFVMVGKFSFPPDFVIVDYECDPRVPLNLGRPFLRSARALIGVHGEEMILRDDNERLTLNMRHDTSSYSTQPHQESINMIDVYNVSHEEILEKK